MSDDRRYSEDDVRRIFERAASAEGARRHTDMCSDGLTLAELQEIAEEVGLSPLRIADAAATLELPCATEHRSRLGMPVSVSRTAPLARLPTHHEWELLLAELRSTFGVLGTERSRGNAREWTDGTLFAVIEPTDTGGRIRLGSSRPLAVFVNVAGVAWILAAAIALLTLIRTGDLAGGNVFLPPIIGAVGVSTIVYNGKRLKRWARRCAAHMDQIVGRARSIVRGEHEAPLQPEAYHTSTEHDAPQSPLS